MVSRQRMPFWRPGEIGLMYAINQVREWEPGDRGKISILEDRKQMEKFALPVMNQIPIFDHPLDYEVGKKLAVWCGPKVFLHN